MSEIWKTHHVYTTIECSNEGRVRRVDNCRVIGRGKTSNGYHYVFVMHHGTRKNVKVHRLVAQCFIDNPRNLPFIDHIDGDKTNNNINNLRFCTPAENQHNQRVISGRGSSSYKGVCWDKFVGKWRAFIRVDGRNTALGCYTDEKAAAHAYNAAARERFREFARLNVID